MSPVPDDKLKGISTSAEVERLSGLLSTLSDAINRGQIPTVTFTPANEPNVQTQRITEGYTYYDKTLKKVRTWDGSAWKDHF
jgi:hypothetical protein